MHVLFKITNRVYLPTDEEREAASQGYDFANPEAWFEKQKQQQTAAASSTTDSKDE
jgi:hypothetical protein